MAERVQLIRMRERQRVRFFFFLLLFSSRGAGVAAAPLCRRCHRRMFCVCFLHSVARHWRCSRTHVTLSITVYRISALLYFMGEFSTSWTQRVHRAVTSDTTSTTPSPPASQTPAATHCEEWAVFAVFVCRKSAHITYACFIYEYILWRFSPTPLACV